MYREQTKDDHEDEAHTEAYITHMLLSWLVPTIKTDLEEEFICSSLVPLCSIVSSYSTKSFSAFPNSSASH